MRAKPTDHFSTRLRRPGGLGGPGCLVLALKAQRGGAREVIESAEARHALGAFLPLHLSGVSSWVASRDHRDFQDDRDGPVAQAAPESIRPLAHATPLVDATPPPGGRSLRDRQRVAVVGPPQSRVDGNRVARGPPDHFSTRLRRPGGLGGPGCPVLALKAQRGVPERSSNQPKPGAHQAHSCRFI